RPSSMAKPVDPGRSDDPPTLARPRGAPVGPPPLEEFDDNVDTIVSDSFPEMDDFRQQLRKGPGAGANAGGGEQPQTAVTQTLAASPVAMAVHSGPRPAPP